VGDWLGKYGDSIYGTRGGPIPPGDWGVSTEKGNKIYVHILNWKSPLLALAPIASKISTAQTLIDGKSVEFTQSADGEVLKVPAAKSDEWDRVVVLTVSNSR